MNESESQISVASEQSSQMSDFDISEQDEEEFLGLDFDKQAEVSSEKSESYLKMLFRALNKSLKGDLEEDFITFDSRRHIDDLFNRMERIAVNFEGVKKQESIFAEYLLKIYRTNYQYFPYMIKRNKKPNQTASKKIQKPKDRAQKK